MNKTRVWIHVNIQWFKNQSYKYIVKWSVQKNVDSGYRGYHLRLVVPWVLLTFLFSICEVFFHLYDGAGGVLLFKHLFLKFIF